MPLLYNWLFLGRVSVHRALALKAIPEWSFICQNILEARKKYLWRMDVSFNSMYQNLRYANGDESS